MVEKRKPLSRWGRNADKVHVNWSPNSQVIAYAETGELRSGNEQEILMVGQNHENFRSIIAPGQDFLPNWSPRWKTDCLQRLEYG
jgi:hypothetical protein